MRQAVVLILVAAVAAGIVTRVATAKPTAARWFNYRGVVVHVVDGDTIDATVNGKRQRVRLIGIDTPEVGVCYAAQATVKARVLALRKTVRLIGDRTQARRDRYGRLLAYVVLPGGVDLGRVLIAGGFGKVYVYDRPFARLARYRAAENAAKAASAGAWAACATSTAAPSTTTTETATTVAAPAPPPPATTAPATTPAPLVGNCDASYPDFCIPPPPPDLDCKDIPRKGFTVRAPDPHRFDGNHNGAGCET